MSERGLNGHGLRTLIFGIAMGGAAYFGRGWIERQDRSAIEIQGDYRIVMAELAKLEKNQALLEQRDQMRHEEVQLQIQIMNRKLETLLDRKGL